MVDTAAVQADLADARAAMEKVSKGNVGPLLTLARLAQRYAEDHDSESERRNLRYAASVLAEIAAMSEDPEACSCYAETLEARADEIAALGFDLVRL